MLLYYTSTCATVCEVAICVPAWNWDKPGMMLFMS